MGTNHELAGVATAKDYHEGANRRSNRDSHRGNEEGHLDAGLRILPLVDMDRAY